MNKWKNITKAQKEMYAAFDFFRGLGFDAADIFFGCDDESIGLVLAQGKRRFAHRCGMVENPEKELREMREIGIEISQGTVPEKILRKWMLGSQIMKTDSTVIAQALASAGFVPPRMRGILSDLGVKGLN